MARQQFVQIDIDIERSLNFRRLAKRGGGPEAALSCLFHLWAWALSQGFDGGRFEWDEPEAVEEAAGLEPGAVEALIDTGFLEDEQGSWYRITGWEDRYGRLDRLREYDRLRKAKERALADQQLGSSPADSPTDGPVTSTEGHGTVHMPEERRGEKKESLKLPAPASGWPSFPCVGKESVWAPTQNQVDGWLRSFPNLDILSEALKALAWIEASPERRKTARGMPRFLVGWFGRSVNSNLRPLTQQARAAVDPPQQRSEQDPSPEMIAAARSEQAARYYAQAKRAEEAGLKEIAERLIEQAQRFEKEEQR